MKLQLIKTIGSPVSGKDQSIWISAKDKSFYITDRWKVVRIDPSENFEIRVISETADQEDAYQMKGIYDKRLPDPLYDEISAGGIAGFKLLSKTDYDSIDSPAGSASFLEMANRYGPIDRNLPLLAHNASIVTFGNKSLWMERMEGNALISIDTVKTKGKAPVHAHLHPNLNLIVYGTNYGEIYGQYFNENSFGKAIKIDNLQKPCYQTGFTQDGEYLIVCGMGYVKLYIEKAGTYSEISTIQTSARSFEILENYLILNKGMHGMDVFLIGDKPEKKGSLELPFAIDRMICHQPERLMLLTSNPHGEIAFVKLTDQ
ncbi:hypothetical protein [Dyadobacter pollutisoli]|uniref:Uncharacterized protein n=1 Tax=Dyadobacter pollutisoli TaxID=2910158 RepID=A0A9E8NBT1_9BACT|nr:hypothetical protein [Dyadobacter pollutisoli]WAC13759.1 hypothetical protein ON006_07320 [Dyadobacter pollutisoli]